MSRRNNSVFTFLKIITWVIFISLCFEAGALIVNFIVSLYRPEIVHNLYQDLDLSDLYHRSKSAYIGAYSFILVIAVLKAYLFFVVLQLVSKLNLSNPFNRFVSKKISQISYFTLSIGFLSYLGRQSVKNSLNSVFEIDALNPFWADSQAYILMAAVMYVIATIFSKGIELQTENDLTV